MIDSRELISSCLIYDVLSRPASHALHGWQEHTAPMGETLILLDCGMFTPRTGGKTRVERACTWAKVPPK